MRLSDFDLLLDAEISKIKQAELRLCISDHRVYPRVENRAWDYGEDGIAYPCWIGIEDGKSNTAIGYCLEGFGPANPWGLLFLGGEHSSIGMDSGWFISLEDAIRESVFWNDENPENYELS